MLYIEKSKTPRSLLKFIALQKSAGFHPAYTDLRKPYINELDSLLFKEQKGLCCYCMQQIPEDTTKRTREHFLPESQFKLDEVNYFNIYLACNKKSCNTTHCDVTKSDSLISKYIGHPKCEDFFKYNREGEILPKKLPFDEWNKFKTSPNTHEIFEKSPETAEILAAIFILNLNQAELVEKRKNFIAGIIKVMSLLTTKAQCQVEIDKFTNFTHTTPKPFAGVAKYFYKQIMTKLP